MRKNSLFLLGAVTGVCLTLALSGPHGAQLVAVAKAKVEGDIYSQLNLFGDVFERVRADYVEKPDDAQLVEGAINGMITSLDPHSRYMNNDAWHEMQETTSGGQTALIFAFKGSLGNARLIVRHIIEELAKEVRQQQLRPYAG